MIKPALPGEPVAHLYQPHGIVGVVQRVRRLHPISQQQRQRDQEPHQCQKRRKIRLPQQASGEGIGHIGSRLGRYWMAQQG
jgi:hypothetical protein